ncbi:MAG: fused MFS/spermidine synthase [Victivallales bacterium]
MGLLLTGSGACALIYQVTWLRELRLVFGSTTSASAAVLAIFMGGLGIGNALLGKRADSKANPLAFYALLEAAITLAAALSPFLIDAVRATYIQLGGQMALGVQGATIVRLALSALILFIPTLLMGGTLPAAIAAATPAEDRNRLTVAALYGVNTLGAVVGAMASTFAMLPALGTRWTLWSACALNMTVAVSAFALSRYHFGTAAERKPVFQEGSRQKLSQQEGQTEGDPLPNPVLIYTSAGIVGFAFMLMELVWYRMLAPILGGTTYTFGLILSMALLGIGLGATIYPLICRRRNPSIAMLTTTCGLEAVFLALPFALGDNLAIAAAILHEFNSHGFAGEVLGWSAISAIVVLPASIVSGVQFPLLIALLGHGDKNVGRQVGWTYAFNTLGSIVGSLVGGFGLLTLLSAVGTWRLVVGIVAGLCICLAITVRRNRTLKRDTWTLFGIGAIAILLLGFTGPTSVWRHSGIGAGRAQLPKVRSANAMQEWKNYLRKVILWEADGIEAGVAIGANNGYFFAVNGKSDGNSIGDAGTQMCLGLLAATVHSQPRTCLVIGLGTGETAGWLGKIPSVDRVDVVEIEPAISEMARRCAEVNGDVLNNPKVHFVYNDAREVLLTTKMKYDIIASEPSNPYRAGIANLFTQEFYRATSNRLNDDGFFIQWLQGYEVDEETVFTALATLRSVFKHVEVWQPLPQDMLILCSNRPFTYDASHLRRRITEEPYRTAFAVSWRTTNIEGILARYIAGERLMDEVIRDRADFLNTDDRNLIEYGFSRTLGRFGGFEINRLREMAIALGAHRPSGKFEGVDWDGVEDQRMGMFAIRKLAIPQPASENRALATRRKAFERYVNDDMQGMISEWESQPRQAVYPTETALLALAYATGGNEKALILARRLNAFNPREADMICGILAQRDGRNQEASHFLTQAFTGMRKDPWPASRLIDVALETACELSAENPNCRREILESLKEPFASMCSNSSRKEHICYIAAMLSPQDALPYVESLEQNLP